jgi:hypothetical protein
MATITLHKEGDRWVLTVPQDESTKLGLIDGEELNIKVRRASSDSGRHQQIDAIMDEVVVEYREAFEYLAQ